MLPATAALCLCFYVQVALSYQPRNTYQAYPDGRSPLRTQSPYDRSQNGNVRLRHQQAKFPNLERVRSRLESLSDGSKPRIRHHGWILRTSTSTTTAVPPTEDQLFEVYGDLEGNEDDGEGVETEDDDFNYEDEDEPNSNDNFFNNYVNENGGDVQAEEPVDRSTPAPRKPSSSLTDYKWTHYGTLESVGESRRIHFNLSKSSEEKKVKAFLEHYMRVKSDGVCKRPIPKVIQIQEEHPNASVTYIPHCTVLHRCAEDTGCCKHDDTCQYKTREEIYLSLYVKQIGSVVYRIEKLKFFNHTSCECRTRGKNDNDGSNVVNTASFAADNSKIAFKSGTSVYIPENLEIKCNCPEVFLPKITSYSKCSCDCEPSNQDCIRMKKGKEYFGMTGRLCIVNNQCGTIECEYGPYIKERGRCPRRDEFLRSKIK